MRRRTWAVLSWKNEPSAKTILEDLPCWECGWEADLPIGTDVIVLASIAGGLVLDNNRRQPGGLPTTIKCRKCRRVFRYERSA